MRVKNSKQSVNNTALKKFVACCYVLLEALNLGLAIITTILSVQKVLNKYKDIE